MTLNRQTKRTQTEHADKQIEHKHKKKEKLTQNEMGRMGRI